MPPIGVAEFNNPVVRRTVRRERAARRARYRARWWFPLLLLLVGLTGCWGVLQTDQWVAEKLIWPTSGAQFVEVGPVPDDPAEMGGKLVIVAGGLNQKSGTRVASALMPALTADHARVFSLVYGSAISDQDLLDKYDALITRLQPQQVGFFGSSMGGDVVLGLAAHAQHVRTDYVTTLYAARPAASTNQGSGSGGGSPGASSLGSFFGMLTAIAGSEPGLPGTGGVADDASGDRRFHAHGSVLKTPDSAAGPAEPVIAPPPRLSTIFLDCSPLGAEDVRDASRTRADALTAVMEATGTEGGVAVRMTAEVLGQQSQWSTGRFPFLQVRGDDLRFKFEQVWREKISTPGISTGLIKDQYGVIRRTDIDDIVDELGPGTQLVYFLPQDRQDDRIVKVEQVETTLRELAIAQQLDVRIIEIPGGSHASAADNTDTYLTAMEAIRTGQT